MSTQIIENEKNQEVLSGSIRARDGAVGGSFENLSTTAKSTKKLKVTKPKKSDQEETNSSEIDFLIFKAKEAFIYLQKAFTKAPILMHFNPISHIWIETDILEYAIDEIFG